MEGGLRRNREERRGVRWSGEEREQCPGVPWSGGGRAEECDGVGRGAEEHNAPRRPDPQPPASEAANDVAHKAANEAADEAANEAAHKAANAAADEAANMAADGAANEAALVGPSWNPLGVILEPCWGQPGS